MNHLLLLLNMELLLKRFIVLHILIQTKVNQLSNIKNEFIMIFVYLIAYIFIFVICGVGYVLIQHGLVLIGFIVEFISLFLLFILGYLMYRDWETDRKSVV